MTRYIVCAAGLVGVLLAASCSREMNPIAPISRQSDFQSRDRLSLTLDPGVADPAEPQLGGSAPIITIGTISFPPGTDPVPGRELSIEVPAELLPLRVSWTATASPGSQLARTRWALAPYNDPPPSDGVISFTSAWIPWVNGEHLVRLGPFPNGDARALFIEVEDDQGRRSLAIIRIRWVAFNPAPVSIVRTSGEPALHADPATR